MNLPLEAGNFERFCHGDQNGYLLLRLIPAPRSADAPIRWRTELLTVRFADKLFARLR